ncbi:hypothetical protein FLONG3_4638 [Fusarium longipes]|uniref:Xylanolytic transcriptional activator regulatory domain-containing protein n=1 Tax=Fusarium longipes TaxID=694270 RepID=A0A395SXC8_9HYPO|nr:hypothetical protein FLONG3_4638 [Fusarium longipes]
MFSDTPFAPDKRPLRALLPTASESGVLDLCSGTRPVCVACTKRSTECQWEETPIQSFKRRCREIVNEESRASAYEQLFDRIKLMTAEDATRTVHKIQTGDDVETLLNDTGPSQIEPHHVENQNSNAYQDFYRMLQLRPEEDLTQILKLVQSGYHVRAILRQIREADLLLQVSVKPEHRRRYAFPFSSKWPEFLCQNGNPYLETPFYEPNRLSQTTHSPEVRPDSEFGIPYHGATLIEPLLSDADISKWTAVTSDESMLIRLLELYFLHDYHFFTYFHKDLFLKDLKSGEMRFCSPLLVNAIFASATHYDTNIKGRNEPWDTDSLCYRFLAETKRLWELEMGESSLPTLQAALVMNAVYNMDGLDQIGNVFLAEATKIAYNLDLFKPIETKCPAEMDIARQFTAWSLFSWQSALLFHYCKPPLLEKPPDVELPNPKVSPSCCPEIFVRYPESGTTQLFFPETFIQTVKFRIIMNDITNDRLGGGRNKAVTFEQAARHCHRLFEWFEHLPPCLKPNRITTPSHFFLHLHFQCVVMLLLESFVESVHAHPSIALPDGTKMTAQEISHEARIRFETLLRVFYLRHSFATYAPVMLQFLSFFGFLTLKEVMAEPDPSSKANPYKSSVILAILGLENQARQAYLANAMFRLLIDQVPPDVADAMSQYYSQDSMDAILEIQPAFTRSAYPVNVRHSGA